MKKAAFLLGLLLSYSSVSARADSKYPVALMAPKAEFMSYLCEANVFTNSSDPNSVIAETGKYKATPLSEKGLYGHARMMHQVGTNVIIGTFDFSYFDLAGEKSQAAVGPVPTHHIPKLITEVNGQPYAAFAGQIGALNYINYSDTPYRFSQLSLFVPRTLVQNGATAPFDAMIDIRYVMGTKFQGLVDWPERYMAICYPEKISKEEFEMTRDFAAAGVGEAMQPTPEFLNREQLSLTGARDLLKERLAGMKPDELEKALGVTLTALLAKQTIKNSPQMLAVLKGATGNLLERVAARQGASGLGKYLAERAAAALGVRTAGLAAGGVLSAATLGLLVGGSSASAAEMGGPGYFFTVPGTQKLVNGSDQNFRHFTEHDALLQNYIVELARTVR